MHHDRGGTSNPKPMLVVRATRVTRANARPIKDELLMNTDD
jgi:hypothetical protein